MCTLQSCGIPSHLGNKHEALPDHEGAEDDHGEVEALEEELALVRPELLQLEDLLVYHFSEHFLMLLLARYKDKEQRCEPPESEVAVVRFVAVCMSDSSVLAEFASRRLEVSFVLDVVKVSYPISICLFYRCIQKYCSGSITSFFRLSFVPLLHRLCPLPLRVSCLLVRTCLHSYSCRWFSWAFLLHLSKEKTVLGLIR